MTTSRTLGWSPTEIDGINLLQRNGLFDAGAPVQADLDWRFTKLVGLWAPRRWLTPETMDVDGMVAEIEQIVATRGLVAHAGRRELRGDGSTARDQGAPASVNSTNRAVWEHSWSRAVATGGEGAHPLRKGGNRLLRSARSAKSCEPEGPQDLTRRL